MNITELLPWLVAANTLITIIGVAYSVLTARSKGNSEKLEALERKVEDQLQRTRVLEAKVAAMPGIEATHGLEVAIERLNGRLDTLDQKLTPLSKMNDLMQSYMVERSK